MCHKDNIELGMQKETRGDSRPRLSGGAKLRFHLLRQCAVSEV